MSSPTKPSDNYTPIYFLASLGAGGLVVTFFMYLLFWVPHKGRAVPVFEDILAKFNSGDIASQIMIVIAMAGIAFFAILNLKSLFWNLSAYNKFKKTEAYKALRSSNAESAILAMPLALAMTVNMGFIVGLVFVPGLWNIVEYLFPLALLAFAIIGYIAFREIGHFLGRVLSKGGIFDVTAHNSFAQLVPAFALSMVAVGLSAPSAMSHNPMTISISMVLSTAVGLAAVLYGVLAAITALNSMLHYGTHEEAAPTLMIVVPMVTTLGIMFLRQNHAMHTFYDVHITAGDTFMLMVKLFTIQLMFLGLGLMVLKRQGYFKDFVFGSKTSPGSYALVCPGVALSVMVQFLLNKGFVATGVIDKYSMIYWAVTAIAIALQFAMVALVLRLNKQHFGKQTVTSAVPAE